jgi:hypothetical protein
MQASYITVLKITTGQKSLAMNSRSDRLVGMCNNRSARLSLLAFAQLTTFMPI